MISRSDADHVRVANLAAFDDFDDSHTRAEFAGLRRHGHDADVGVFERVENQRGRGLHRSWAEVFEKQRQAQSFAFLESGFDGGGDGTAFFVSDQRDFFVRLDGEASFNGIVGARHQLGLRRAECRNHIFILAQLDCNFAGTCVLERVFKQAGRRS